jgi:2-C-methyl-D-erythritol 4-phosphate cytidylyltransferase
VVINPKTVAIIPAAGAGVRMGSDRRKQFLDLNGKPILAVTLEIFEACPLIDHIILVAPAADLDFCRSEIVTKYGFQKVQKVVAGGDRRQDSVRLGIAAIEGTCQWVLIHDAVRPLINLPFIMDVIKAAQEYRAVITALPLKETIKETDDRGTVLRTLERNRLRLVQTPQIFRYADIRLAHQKALQEQWGHAPDDAFLVETLGIPVQVIKGLEENIKITTPHDLELAKVLLSRVRA